MIIKNKASRKKNALNNIPFWGKKKISLKPHKEILNN